MQALESLKLDWLPPARKKIKKRVLDTFCSAFEHRVQPLMTVATAFLALLVPVGAWIENEDSVKGEF